MKKDEDTILDAAEVGELLCLKTSTVYRLAQDGRIPCYKLPGTRLLRFSKKAVLDWMRSGEKGGTPERQEQ
jgi:excisionase family DNA binding protein